MMRRNQRPSLMGTMARTAVIAGTATVTSNAISSRAHQKAAAQNAAAAQAAEGQQQMAAMQAQVADLQAQVAAQPVAAPAAPEPAAPAGGDIAAQLTQLKTLVDQGIISQDDFDAKKRQLLGI